MERCVIRPAPLSGTVKPPPSKSAEHRAIICAALAKGMSVISPYVPSEDIDATIAAMRALGAGITLGGELHIDGSGTLSIREATIDCRESGSTLRFLIPVAAAGGGIFTFIGSGRLPERPIGPYLSCLPGAGVLCETAGGLPLKLTGRLEGGAFAMPGDVSSQFITGLLLALPLTGRDSTIALTSPLQSKGYIDLTTDMMGRFGVSITEDGGGYLIKGGQAYAPHDICVEGDWSQAAFWLAAGALGQKVACEGLSLATRQGDMAITGLLRRFGATVASDGFSAEARPGGLCGIEIDASQIPDLVPILAAVACFARGRTLIKNAARLRLKESDRLHTIALGLRALGARVTELDDGLAVEGGPLTGGEADGAGDHRIVMALSIAAAFCTGGSVINGCGCIKKSYPDFYKDFKMLGGDADVIGMG